MTDNKLSEMISSSLDSIRTIADSGTVVGDPIPTNNGTVIIAVSKVSVGFASGGLDYLPKTGDGKDASTKTVKGQTPCFGGGGGTGVTVTPVCFLVVSAEGNVTMMNITSPAAAASGPAGTINSISSFAEKVPDIISRIKEIFAKKTPETALDDEKLAADIEEMAEKLEKEAEKK